MRSIELTKIESYCVESCAFSSLRFLLPIYHVKRVPRHHGMARPQVADGGGFHIWSVAANILNKKSPTADKGLSSRLKV
jgi:hypothetical protein